MDSMLATKLALNGTCISAPVVGRSPGYLLLAESVRARTNQITNSDKKTARTPSVKNYPAFWV
jgi:hypothetical protein